VPAVDPVPVDGQVNEPLNEPEPSVVAEPAEVGELQSVVPIPKVTVPLASAGQVAAVLVPSCTPLPVTAIVVPTGPCAGLGLVIESVGAAGVHVALTRVLA
jgi:hypothetical protein